MVVNNQKHVPDLRRRVQMFELQKQWHQEAGVNPKPITEGGTKSSSEVGVRLEESAAFIPPHTEGKER